MTSFFKEKFAQFCLSHSNDAIYAARFLVLSVLALAFVSAPSLAAIPAPGTVIINSATSSHVTATGPQTVTTNTVATTVAAAVAVVPNPTLTKLFASAGISDGDATSLTFTITNAALLPAQSGVSFIDLLPAGLALKNPVGVITGAGCTAASITFALPGTIVVNNVGMAAGTPNCTVTISGVTNRNGALNLTQCGAINAPDFTNDAASVTGIANLLNNVAPQCLLVTPIPKLTKQFGAPRIADGENTSLTFTLTNVVGAPAAKGIAFTDTLPAGLKLTAAPTFVVQGSGCSAQVSFSAPSQITVTGATLPASAVGSATCTVVITGVTNQVGSLNPAQCGTTNATSFTNDAASVSGALGVANAIAPQCLLVGATPPQLSKKFSAARIVDGESTTLSFTIANSPSAPAVSGVTFTDTLPAGLKLTAGATFAIQGAGCTGQVALNAPSQIAVTGLSLAAGTSSCTIVVSGVTNATGALNSTCAAAPAAFTNGPTSISNVSGVANAVQNTCLIVNTPDVIRGYVDNGFRLPTLLALVGKDIFFSANAPSCNQNPDIIERRIVIITGPNGEREEIVSVETSANSGVFTTSGLAVRSPPVVAGNGTLEGRSGDVYSIELLGCGRKIVTTLTLVDPNGVVFDSRTNEPVEGATVSIVNATNGVCSTTLASVSTLSGNQVVPSPNPVTTGRDGRFEFPLVSAGNYCLRVVAPNGYTWTSVVPANQLPGGRNILVTSPSAITGGSYGGAFRVGPDTGPIIVDIPVDAGPISGLFVQKTTLRTVVEMGEFVDYVVNINNNTGVALDRSDVLAVDSLPAGFTFVSGSARADGKPIAEPTIGSGQRITFNIGRMARAQQVKLTYRVRVGPGALQGDGVNRVVANYRIGTTNLVSESNVATAKVNVVGGVFTNSAYIIGKVYADCNKDLIQNDNEVGVPGVRIYLEDGTNIITDAEGKYSFYGISARTHVLKVDRTTLPAGLDFDDLAQLSNRNLGKGDSRFVDLKNGELHKADFALQSCKCDVVEAVSLRRKAAASLKTEVDGRLQQRLETDANLRSSTDVKALPASGVIGNTAQAPASPGTTSFLAPNTVGGVGTSSAINSAANAQNATLGSATNFETLAPAQPVLPSQVVATPDAPPVLPLENILPLENNSLGFIGINDGDVLPFAQTNLRVKGLNGTTFKLEVNDKEVKVDRVGKRAILDDKKVQAWEYFGVELVPGTNTLSVSQLDQFGNARGVKTIKVMAPGALTKVIVEFPNVPVGGVVADGKTPAKVLVRLTDANGVPVTSRTAVTLSTSLGRWDVEDLNPVEPGVQTFVIGGKREFTLLPPNEPGQAKIRVSGGSIKEEAQLDFLPDLRDLLAVGLIEGVLNLRKLDTRALVPARAQDGFEQEISHISRTWNDGKYNAAARAAMFIKGKIKGEYLLTLAYDSDKGTRERLFRDIQPDEFYPVYGDSSLRGFDAQSTGRFYVRIDKKKSYLLYGDYNTSAYSEARKLSAYNRSLTGVKQHFESSNVLANIFASRDSTKQIIEEFRANGTSGPFTLGNARGLINSEKIDILTRDRSQNAIILKVVPQSRFADYEIEPLTGRILFKAPIASLDENLNPISVRVTYEVDQGGQEFWVAGGDVQVKLSDRIEVGATIVDDRNPVDKFRMAGVNAIAKLADKTFFIAEIAQTNREKIAAGLSAGDKQGRAARVEFKHQDGKIDATVYAGRADANFDNQSSSLSTGRLEVGAKLAYKIDDKTNVRGELLRTEDVVTGGKRDGLLVSAERVLENNLRVELGLRHARESQAAATNASANIPSEVTAVRGRVTGEVPNVKNASVYGELEVDPSNTARKIAAVGGEYKLSNNGRLYARHEFISSLTGPYGLNTTQQQNSTVFGLSTDYMKDGNLFSEYRIRDAISGGDAEAALGLRNMWTIAEGIRLSTSLERVHVLKGTGQGESTAATVGVEYTANPLWKGSTRLELRNGQSSDSVLSTVAIASKLNRDWTFLGRNTFSLVKNKNDQSGENQQDRLQAGLAYRDTDTDVWNALGRVEHRTEKDTTQPGVELKRTVELASVHANWQPVRPFIFSGRYAAKWATDQSNRLKTKNNAQLLAGRAIWEIAPRWDVSANASTLLGKGAQAKQYGLGLELGFMVMENLWVSAGYNFFGYRDEDLASGDYTNKGAFVRLRYKFDEDLFSTSKQKISNVTSGAAATNAEKESSKKDSLNLDSNKESASKPPAESTQSFKGLFNGSGSIQPPSPSSAPTAPTATPPTSNTNNPTPDL